MGVERIIMEMKIYNVYYKGGYIGYVLVPDHYAVPFADEPAIIRWLALKFGQSAKKHMRPDSEIKAEEIKPYLTIELKEGNVNNMFFKRQVFNDSELGDDFSFASV